MRREFQRTCRRAILQSDLPFPDKGRALWAISPFSCDREAAEQYVMDMAVLYGVIPSTVRLDGPAGAIDWEKFLKFLVEVLIPLLKKPPVPPAV